MPTKNPQLPLRSSSHRTYTHIPGTHTYLKIPAGFELSETFPGLESKRKHAQIHVKELRGQSFKQNGAQFSKGMLAPGQKHIETRQLELGNFEACLMKFSHQIPSLVPEQTEHMMSLILAVGDDTYLSLLVASYPAFREKELGKEIEECLLGLTYDPTDSLKTSMHSLASFEINCQPVGLELAETKTLIKEQGNSFTLIFTQGGQPLTGLSAQYRLLVSENNWASVSQDWPVQRIFQDNFFSSFEAMESEKISVDELEGQETWAIEKSKQTPGILRLAYHVVLFDGESRHFEIRGYASDDEINQLKAFKQVARSFRRR